MSMDMSASTVMMRTRMRRTRHRVAMLNQRTMWRTEGIVQDSVNIGLYISDL
jgi:hypothetical protein